MFYLRKHTESGRVSATHVLVEKRYGVRERLIACQQGTQDAFYLRKQRESGGWYSAHFSLKNTTISKGQAGVTCKFTIEIKARRILH